MPLAVSAQQGKPLGAQLRVRWDGYNNIVVIKDGVKHVEQDSDDA